MASTPPNQDYCEVCKLTEQIYGHAGPRGVRVTCKRCGNFTWNPLEFHPSPETREQQVRFSAFIQDQNAAGIEPHLTAELVQQVKRTPVPLLREHSLRALAGMGGEVGNNTNSCIASARSPKIQAVSYSANEDELWILICVLEQQGFVKLRERPSATSLRPSISALSFSRVRSDAGILSIGVLLRGGRSTNRTSLIRLSGEGAPQPFFQQA